jgi:hypothetical protein
MSAQMIMFGIGCALAACTGYNAADEAEFTFANVAVFIAGFVLICFAT